ncbi:Hypothetical protein NTJ_06590 [Nesidiocoris tenuis]|uniref:Uncharacterized protein n=1 Tax=Nesidiocoris tenuis TaxID=355587 RepID=A0ABN7AR17_9HEMI|nr:Hypothetical protein NTJ_06590 [Nesidiocoris tenuis]
MPFPPSGHPCVRALHRYVRTSSCLVISRLRRPSQYEYGSVALNTVCEYGLLCRPYGRVSVCVPVCGRSGGSRRRVTPARLTYSRV